MTYADAKKRVAELADRLRESASDLQSSAPGLSKEREQDAIALGIVLGPERGGDSVCPTCGV